MSKSRTIIKKLLKISAWIGLALGVIIIGAVIYIFLIIRASIPDWDGEIEMNGINSRIKIIMDEYGVPHIYADNENDLFFAVGFIHARERLFQMDMERRYISGTLSEVIGRQTVGLDRKMRRLMMLKWAENEFESLSGKNKQIIERYCAGVNYIIKNGPIPPEYKLLRIEPAPWKPVDTILTLKNIGWLLSTSGGELDNAEVLTGLGKEWFGFLRDRILENPTTILPADLDSSGETHSLKSQVQDGYTPAEIDIIKLAINDGFARDADEVRASNAWVVDGALTKTGKPLLANDQHLFLQNPTQFYQLHMRSPQFNVCGLSLPGTPFVCTGHNEKIAWGMSALQPDNIDYFIVETKPDDPDSYRYRNEWIKFQKVKEIIKIKGEDVPEVRYIKYTKFGPVITGKSDPGPAVAMKWTGMYPSKTFNAIYKLSRAGNREEFLEAMRDWSLPHLNIIYADKDGNIGYYPTGYLPVRSGWDGSFPLKPDSDMDWTGLYEEAVKPYLFNPKQHFIVTANNQIGTSEASKIFSTDWILPFRAQRISELLKNRNGLNTEDMTHIQMDTYSYEADLILNALREVKIDNPVVNRLFQNIIEWNRKFEGGYEPALYSAFRYNLQWYLLADEIRYINRTLSSHSRNRLSPLMRALNTLKFKNKYPTVENRNWWDDIFTSHPESKEEIIERSIGAAEQFLKKFFTHKWKEKSWGEMHQLIIRHPLGEVWPLDKLFNIGPYEMNGTGGTVMATGYDMEFPFIVNFMPIFRMVIDLSNFDNSLIIKNAGQSGNPFSRRYDDESDLYVAGKYNRMLYSDETVNASTESVMILVPIKK